MEDETLLLCNMAEFGCSGELQPEVLSSVLPNEFLTTSYLKLPVESRLLKMNDTIEATIQCENGVNLPILAENFLDNYDKLKHENHCKQTKKSQNKTFQNDPVGDIRFNTIPIENAMDKDRDSVGELLIGSFDENRIEDDELRLTRASSCSSCPEIVDSECADDKDSAEPTSFRSDNLQRKIEIVVQRWGKSCLTAPDKCLTHLLQSRGYSAETIKPHDFLLNRPSLSSKEIKDYDNELVYAVRMSDLKSIKRLHSEGYSMMACNKFGESVLHLACRRATPEVVKYILANGGNLRLVDDYGRNPLHDACWRGEPDFDIVSQILSKDLDLLRMQDVRGAAPLHYVRQEHWMYWCAYLYHQREKYWPVNMIPPCRPSSPKEIPLERDSVNR
eukprot:gene8647-17839_t